MITTAGVESVREWKKEQNMVAVYFDILLPFNLLQQGKQSFIKTEKFIFTTFK